MDDFIANLNNEVVEEQPTLDYFKPPRGIDGLRIIPGEVVYGQDCKKWFVKAVGSGHYDVYASEDPKSYDCKPLKSSWLTHIRPTIETILNLFGEEYSSQTDNKGRIDSIKKYSQIVKDFKLSE